MVIRGAVLKTDHNEIVHKSQDGNTIEKPNSNVICRIIKRKVVKFDDIVT